MNLRHGNRLVAALILADFSYAYLQTSIIPAISPITRELHTSANWTLWLFTGFLVLTSIAAPIGSKLGDLYGKDRLLIAALLIFVTGCVGASLAPGIASLVFFRSLQGGGGATYPLSISLIKEHSSAEEVPMRIGLLDAGFGLGSATGFICGGIITEMLTWRYIFATGAFALIISALTLRALTPGSQVQPDRRADWQGGLMLGGGFMMILTGVTMGPQWHWNWAVGLFFTGGVAALGAYVWRELSISDPLLDLRVLGKPVVALNNAGAAAAGFVLATTYVVSALFVEGPHGVARRVPGAYFGFAASPIMVGYLLVPFGFGLICTALISARVIRRTSSPAAVFAAGALIITGGVLSLTIWRVTPWQVAFGEFGVGLGYGAAMVSTACLVLNSVEGRNAAAAAGIMGVLLLVMGGIGSEIAHALIAAVPVPGTKSPSALGLERAFWLDAALAMVTVVITLALTIACRRGSKQQSRQYADP
jgi:MFS family permease